MKRQSDNHSKAQKIVSISSKGRKVILELDDRKIILSEEVFSDGFFYPGKELDEEEISRLENLSKQTAARTYLSTILSRSRYTEKTINDRLKMKFNLSREEITQIVSYYKEMGVIDDRRYAMDYLESKAENGYGIDYITLNLRKKGISKEIIDEVTKDFDYESSSEHLYELIKKNYQKYSNLPLHKKKEKIITNLINKGYRRNDIDEALNDYLSEADDKHLKIEHDNELVLLGKEAQKCYNSIKDRPIDSTKKKRLFYSRMLNRGFNAEDIKEYLQREEIEFK